MLKKVLLSILLIALLLQICSCGSTNNLNLETYDEKIETEDANANKNKFPNFQTIDLNDNEISENIFSNKDLTVLNVWGTYCGPCIYEMPELADWNNNIQDNLQLLGLIIDVDSENKINKEAALKIIDETGANYTHLLINDDFKSITDTLIGVPTTFFIDKEGNIVSEPIIGAQVSKYKEKVDKYFKEVIY